MIGGISIFVCAFMITFREAISNIGAIDLFVGTMPIVAIALIFDFMQCSNGGVL